jgi:hypothetical protein
MGTGPDVDLGLGGGQRERGVVEKAKDGGRGSVGAEVCIPEERRRIHLIRGLVRQAIKRGR